MPSQGALILRLFLAAALAGALGGERELTEQPAGFRTHILVGLGAALFAMISAYGFQSIAGLGPRQVVRADVTRIASQIVVGIGFLGGGAILKYGASIRGLTTAASLWVTAAVGTAVGIGQLLLGTATTGITLIALVGLRPLRGILRRYAVGREEFIVQAGPSLDIDGLVRSLRASGGSLLEMRITEDADERIIHLFAQMSRGVRPTEVATALAGVDGVRNVDWSR
jgi:putative Mg2+ transporter-C (MgtC) family protein